MKYLQNIDEGWNLQSIKMITLSLDDIKKLCGNYLKNPKITYGIAKANIQMLLTIEDDIIDGKFTYDYNHEKMGGKIFKGRPIILLEDHNGEYMEFLGYPWPVVGHNNIKGGLKKLTSKMGNIIELETEEDWVSVKNEFVSWDL